MIAKEPATTTGTTSKILFKETGDVLGVALRQRKDVLYGQRARARGLDQSALSASGGSGRILGGRL